MPLKGPPDCDHQARPVNAKTVSTAALIAAGVMVASGLAAKWEGFAAKPYRDPANIVSWCYGETQGNPLLVYTKSQCGDLLRERMTRDYAPRIIACVPQLQTMPVEQGRFIYGALIDASYNAGWAAVCRSPMAANVRAGRLEAACDSFTGWYVTAQKRHNGKRVGKPFLLKGLVNRRADERRVCRKGLI